jgi:hypothetical protein
MTEGTLPRLLSRQSVVVAKPQSFFAPLTRPQTNAVPLRPSPASRDFNGRIGFVTTRLLEDYNYVRQ